MRWRRRRTRESWGETWRDQEYHLLTLPRFHLFFNQVDNFRTDYFLWATAGGLEASRERTERTGERVPRQLEAELGDDADGVVEVGT